MSTEIASMIVIGIAVCVSAVAQYLALETAERGGALHALCWIVDKVAIAVVTIAILVFVGASLGITVTLK